MIFKAHPATPRLQTKARKSSFELAPKVHEWEEEKFPQKLHEPLSTSWGEFPSRHLVLPGELTKTSLPSNQFASQEEDLIKALEQYCVCQEAPLSEASASVCEEEFGQFEKTRDFTTFSFGDVETSLAFYDRPMVKTSSMEEKPGQIVLQNHLRKFGSFQELLHTIVLPNWVEYLHRKKLKTRSIPEKRLKDVTIHKKVLRDCREFFRILFRNRFKHFEFEQNNTSKLECISILLFELGIFAEPPDVEENPDLLRLYPFLYQVHVPKGGSGNPDARLRQISDLYAGTPEVFDKFNHRNLNAFIEDSVCLALTQHVFAHFQELYLSQIKSNLRNKVKSFLKKILKVPKLE